MTAELAMRSAAQQQQLRDAKHAENLQLRDAARAQNAAAHAAGVSWLSMLRWTGEMVAALYRANE